MQTTTRRLNPVPQIDTLIFGEFEWVNMSGSEQDKLRVRLLDEAVQWHLAQCSQYREFAKRQRFSRDIQLTKDGLASIPQIPVSLFKRKQLLSVPISEVVHSFTSSGTSGRKSVVYRDAPTLQRFTGGMRPTNPMLTDLVYGLTDDSGIIMNLGPDRREAGDLWFAFVMNLVEQVATMRHYVVDGKFQMEDAARELHVYLDECEHVLLCGPPFLVTLLADHIRRSGPPMHGGKRLSLFTGGGWKNFVSETLSPSTFRDVVGSTFGLAGENQIRDVFNQVELNSLLMECRDHKMHVPPWVHVFTRDPATFEPLPPGQEGVLCYSDASATSYPCFIISDDLGMVSSNRCTCGLDGYRLSFSRRLKDTTHEGCADTMVRSVHIPI